jgi:restriction system protein
MPIPDYETIMLPLLMFLSDREVRHLRESINAMALVFGLSEDEMAQRLPSGVKRTFDDRVSWASTYMKKAGLLQSPKRGHYQITERGLDVLHSPPSRITNEFLEQYPEFQEFRARRSKPERGSKTVSPQEEEKTPEESLEEGYLRLRDELASELLQTVKECSPSFFENLVIDLLVRMGYGGTRQDAGKAIGGTADGGIDGIIKEDRLGLDVVYLQAKRWDAVVGRPEIQKFAGALQGQRAKKGVFITTSSFTKDALSYANSIDSKLILIDGDQLAQLMIDFDIGVTSIVSYHLKRIDSDYFTEE